MPPASTILMIRPASFGYNEETAVNNFFQSQLNIGTEELQQKAVEEFDNATRILSDYGINVIVIDDIKDPPKPDAIFPNNWLSTSPDGIITIFPMYAPNRRLERRDDILKLLKKKFIVKEVQDITGLENEGHYLEGTGSMVVDNENKMIYAAISERTSVAALEKFASTGGYQAIAFIATDKNGKPVYHTNVMMCLGDHFAVLCEESIEEEWELIAVRQLLESTGHSIIPITKEQMHDFAGNMLLVKNNKEQKFLLMSERAYLSLRKEQKQMLEAYASLITLSIPTIEKVEGGSVRCMMAEIFLELCQ